MILERIKSILLSIALGAHNAAVVVILNVIAWRNNMWNESKWTEKTEARKSEILNPKSETNSKSQIPMSQTTAFEI